MEGDNYKVWLYRLLAFVIGVICGRLYEYFIRYEDINKLTKFFDITIIDKSLLIINNYDKTNIHSDSVTLYGNFHREDIDRVYNNFKLPEFIAKHYTINFGDSPIEKKDNCIIITWSVTRIKDF
jgi:hypothetical protein